jgi:hypothetical protein
LKKGKRAVIQLIKNRFGETFESGVEILALPEIAYIGDFNDDTEESKEDLDLFMAGLINGTI